MGVLGVVFFSPQEIKLIQESPDDRRKFLNIALSQQDKTYFRALNDYKKILLNKNNLLKKGLTTEQVDTMLDVYDSQLAKEGEFIINKRMNFVSAYKFDFVFLYAW